MKEHKNYDETIIKGELQLFRTLWNTSSDNMFIIKYTEDGEFITEKTNDALKRSFNLKKEEVDGVPLRNVLDESTYEKITSRYKTCMVLKKPISYEEKHIINYTGERYWHTTILPIQDENNESTRVFGLSRDITELKMINETLEVEVKKRTRDLEKALKKIKKMSVTDKLTGLSNRYELDLQLEEVKRVVNCYDNVYGIILFDIDDFKQINDTFGHYTGDIILKEFSKILKKNTRETDIVGRWGGEEFLIIAPFSTKESILKLADNLKETIESYQFPRVGKVTSSIGVTLSKVDDDSETIITRSDIALYKAKKLGKNRVEFDY